MSGESWTPERAAHRLAKIGAICAQAHSLARFPVDVSALALDAANIFHWTDPITKVQAAAIKGFEGALLPGNDRKEWLLLYNDAVTSRGRMRFTQAHELGHYILHRLERESFQCTNEDMLNWSDDERDLEAQADLFASYLLMPLDDFRRQVTTRIDLEAFRHCADRYGVSLTAAILKWLKYTDERAVLLISNDGFINWAWSSEPAFRSGAYFPTRKKVIPLPELSVAADLNVTQERRGRELPASIWFPHAATHLSVREMKIHSERHDSVLTLLRLPRGADVWAPRQLAEE